MLSKTRFPKSARRAEQNESKNVGVGDLLVILGNSRASF